MWNACEMSALVCVTVSLVSIKLGEPVGRKRPVYEVRGPRFRHGHQVDSGAVLTSEGPVNVDMLVKLEGEGMCVLTSGLQS